MQLDQGQKSAARKSHGVRDDGEAGERYDEADHARDDEKLDGVHAHRAQGIDLLVELHDADLRGECAAGAARDDDGGEQHAHLAQHRDGDEVDDEDGGAEPRQLLRAEVRDHHTDEKCDERDDGDGAHAGLLNVPRDR